MKQKKKPWREKESENMSKRTRENEKKGFFPQHVENESATPYCVGPP